MRIFIPHFIIPLCILGGSLFAYYFLFNTLTPLITPPEQITKFEQLLQAHPERASNCGVAHLLNSYHASNAAIAYFQSALKHFLVGGAFGIFLLSVAREIHIYMTLKKNSKPNV